MAEPKPKSIAPKYQDLTGLRFGRLTVLGLAKNKTYSRSRCWLCLCECGNTTTVLAANLKAGRVLACGCLRGRLKSGEEFRRHSVDGSLRGVWLSMIRRCGDPQDDGYPRYGGRGISVCMRWLDGDAGLTGYDCFYLDMGPKPSRKHSIDRRDNDGNYEPGNCRWATRKQQCNNTRTNRRIPIQGATRTVSEWADHTGLPQSTLFSRLQRGISGEMLIAPLSNRGRKKRQ